MFSVQKVFGREKHVSSAFHTLLISYETAIAFKFQINNIKGR